MRRQARRRRRWGPSWYTFGAFWGGWQGWLLIGLVVALWVVWG